ncbi:AAA family ATPase [Bryocella elongata]|uniref:AAA family ATPase n=1 Tax=Bryocella elongata TaxID=863522 RepID=UPI001F241CB8|nr:AAA family ATPase [Bryocella elongata]
MLLVGDSRQHEAVEAGRPFAQLQEAGMRTATLNDIVRQLDPELKHVVEQLARGQVGAAVESFDQQGRVHQVKGRDERVAVSRIHVEDTVTPHCEAHYTSASGGVRLGSLGHSVGNVWKRCFRRQDR